MNFLADESCDFAIIRALRKAGYHVKAIQETLPGAEDNDVADLAAKEKLILLTEPFPKEYRRNLAKLKATHLTIPLQEKPSMQK